MDERCCNKSHLTTVNHLISSFTRCTPFIKGLKKSPSLNTLDHIFNRSSKYQLIFSSFNIKLSNLPMWFTQRHQILLYPLELPEIPSITKQPYTEPCLTHPLQWIFYKDAKISSFSVCNQMHTALQGFKEEI